MSDAHPEMRDWLWNEVNEAIHPTASMNNSPLSSLARTAAEDQAQRLCKAYSRCFSSPEGQVVLSHLKQLTLQRALGPDANGEALRQLEGQRQLVLRIAAFVEQG